jgi:hypothetical protein
MFLMIRRKHAPIREWTGSQQRKRNYKKKQREILKLKNITSDIKSSTDRLNSRQEMVNEDVSLKMDLKERKD